MLPGSKKRRQYDVLNNILLLWQLHLHIFLVTALKKLTLKRLVNVVVSIVGVSITSATSTACTRRKSPDLVTPFP